MSRDRAPAEPFGGNGPRIRLSNGLVHLRVPVRALEAIGGLLPRARADTWRGFVSEHAGLRLQRTGAITATPIVMYHAFALPGERASRFVVPLGRLRRQALLLRLLRYRTLGMTRYVELARDGHAPRRSIVITIDDCYAETAEALAVLRRHGLSATVFAVSGLLGDANRWDVATELSGRRLMSWADLAGLPVGAEIGAHTRTHPELPRLDAESARGEIDGSRADLEQRLGRPVETFAYPHGAVDAATREIVADLPFACACGTAEGLNTSRTDPYLLRRVEVEGTDGLLRFVLKLWLGRGRLRG